MDINTCEEFRVIIPGDTEQELSGTKTETVLLMADVDALILVEDKSLVKVDVS